MTSVLSFSFGFSWPAVPPAELLPFLLNVSIKGVLVLLVAALVIKGLHQASASVRHLVWSLALGGLLALPAFELMLPEWRLPILPALLSSVSAEEAPVPHHLSPAPETSAPDAARVTTADPVKRDDELLAALSAADVTISAPVPNAKSSVTAAPERKEQATEKEARPTAAASLGQTNNDFDPAALPAMPPYKISGVEPEFASLAGGEERPLDWRLLLLLVWAAGVMVVCGRILIGTIKVARIVRQAERVSDDDWDALLAALSNRLGLRQRVELITSEEVVMPLTWGVFRPVVLLPVEAEAWSAECRRIVLLHELSHIQRRDCLTQTLAQFACALHWFNPLAHSAAKRLRIERELACDDQVLAVGTRASEYAGYLVEIASSASSLPATSLTSPLTVGMACSQLESRVRSILDPDVTRRRLNRVRVALAVLLTFGLLAPLAVVNPWRTAAAASSPGAAETSSSNDEAASDGAPAAAGFASLPSAASDSETPYQPQQLAPSVEPRLKEEIDVRSGDGSAVVASATTEELLEAIDARVETASGPYVGQAEGQGKADGGDAAILNRLRLHNITPEFIESARRMGFDNLSTNQLIQLRIHGVTEQYVNEVRSWGYEKPSLNQVVQLKMSGVNTDYVNAVKGMGFEKLTLNRLANLKLHNVTPEYAQEMRAAGFDNLTADQLLSTRVHGINQQFVRDVESWGYGKLSLNELMQVKIHGVTPAFADEVKAMGFRDVPLKQLVSIKIHGVNAAFMREMSDLGFDNLTLEQLSQMKIHGITGAYVRKLRAAGYRNISVKQLIDFKVSGVDEILLRNGR